MSKLFFTADQHFGHKNIIKYCNRPFSSVEEMNKVMVDRWNEVVGKDDTIYVLGDFIWNRKLCKEIPPLLNGKIHFIPGNHDYKSYPDFNDNKIFPSSQICQVNWNQQRIVLCHYPMLSWESSYHGSWHLHGHTHCKIDYPSVTKDRLAFDVGVDGNNFYPYSILDIVSIFNKAIFGKE